MNNRLNRPLITYLPAAKPHSLVAQPIQQALAALMIGFSIFAVLLMVTPLAFELYYQNRIYPGISVGGVDLSGLGVDEAEDRLFQQVDYPLRGRIAFQYGQQIWMANPRQVGLFLDARTSAQAAYSLGRSGSWLDRLSTTASAWYGGLDLPPLMIYDERVALEFIQKEIVPQVDVPIVEASLSINGTDVVVKPGQVGRSLDVPAALQALQPPLQAMTDAIIPLTIIERAPAILDASQQAEIARRILSAPLVINTGEPGENEPGPWTFEPAKLAAMLQIQRVASPEGEVYQVGLDQAQLRAFLQDIAPSFERYPENARFIFNDDTRLLEVIRPATIGRSLDIETSLQLINDRLIAGEHSVSLDMEFTNPAVTDEATGEQLGITELVSSHTSYFYGSSASRVQNIQTASARFHGVLVPPGATFSMASVLGDVSLDNGYAEALIIFGDRTIQGVGGGVCQVSTTLFRTVFFGGFPIVERYPHAYRVGYYEQTSGGGINQNLAGLDATVFVPVVDFKFTNDTPYWLLMETYVDPSARRLTWKFYSTSDGRQMEWETTGVQNIVEPPDPLYEENPDLPQGKITQVDYAADGADVTVTRTVYRDGGVYFTDQINTHYLPWRAIYQYGPGTDIPDQGDEDDEDED
jgi:vancomycin resistance protein YoaR